MMLGHVLVAIHSDHRFGHDLMLAVADPEKICREGLKYKRVQIHGILYKTNIEVLHHGNKQIMQFKSMHT